MTPREKIFQTIKEEMIENIRNASLKTLSDVEELNGTLFSYAHYLNDVPNYLEPLENEIEEDNNNDKEPTPTKKKTPENTGILKRHLAHGHIKTKDRQSVFIPESIIRKHNYKHGDIISFDFMKGSDPNDEIYYFEKVDESGNTKTDKRLFSKGVVEEDPNNGQLFILQSVNGKPFSEVQNTYVVYDISERDSNKYNIEKNDIVDIAWYDGNIESTIRVVWKH